MRNLQHVEVKCTVKIVQKKMSVGKKYTLTKFSNVKGYISINDKLWEVKCISVKL